jgi:hypothetical protein
MAYSVLNECTECDSLFKAVSILDEKIAAAIKNQYINESYLTSKIFCKKRLKRMLIYREIALSLMYNSSYVSPEFTHQQIVSKIKSI